MRPTFNIFTDSPDGEAVWIESVENLKNAREELREVARIAPRRDCFIYFRGERHRGSRSSRGFPRTQKGLFTDGGARRFSELSKFPRQPVHTPSSIRTDAAALGRWLKFRKDVPDS